MKAINARELRRMYESQGVAWTERHLTEALASGDLRPEQFSVRDLFVSLTEGGDELLRLIGYRKSGGSTRALQEAAQAVDTSAFSNIIGQLVVSRILERYNDPAFLWPELCETIKTDFLDGEKIPGIGRLGDKAEIVDEGQPFPSVGLNEEWVQTGPTVKRGFIVPVTREIIIADRTGILLREAGEGGHWLGLNKEKRVVDEALGVTNSYSRNATASNTYLTSGAYVNDQTGNALDGQANEWRAIEKAELLFDAITDPNTGEPVIVQPDTLIVPSALKRTAARILNATDVQTVDMRANATTIRTTSKNPYTGQEFKLLSSPYVKKRTGSATKWFFGQPKRAFAYMEVWDIEALSAASNSEVQFTMDIWERFKVSERGRSQTLQPRFMTRNDQ